MKSAIPIIHGHIIKPTAHIKLTHNYFKYTNAENIICTDAGTKLNNNIDLKEQLMLFRAMTNSDILHHRDPWGERVGGDWGQAPAVASEVAVLATSLT